LNRPGVQRCFFASIYAVETSLLRQIEPGKIGSIVPIFIQRIAQSPGSVLGIVLDDGNWQSPDSVEDYERMRLRANALEGF
jgi:NDP-sugar pyrophosphorylase family protein